MQFSNDQEGELLGVDDKDAQGRGFFDWKHNTNLPGGLSYDNSQHLSTAMQNFHPRHATWCLLIDRRG